MSTLDRQLDNRWNKCLDHLCAAWDRLGPDVTLSWLKALAGSQVTDEGVVLVNIAAAETDGEAPKQKPGPFTGVGRRKAEHGTNSGYQAHIAYGIPPCDECRAARSAYTRDYERRKREAPVTDKGAATDGEVA